MSNQVAPAIAAALSSIPADLRARSGSVFYTSRAAFRGPAPIYLLGLNPGGDPMAQAGETIAADIEQFWSQPDRWSAYADESWQGATPGAWGMQPRVLHMLQGLGLDPQGVPASNVVFVRSSSEAALNAEKSDLLRACWPVHDAVISALGIRAIICFGGTAGRWVREQIGALGLMDSFQESNARGWTSEAHAAPDGRVVVTVTHPSRADWRNPAADPTQLVKRVIGMRTDVEPS